MTEEARRRIEITGVISREELVRMYHSADVLVLPSIYPEGFGIPIVEAAACRVPAVVTRRGGMPEVVEDGTSGFVVDTIEEAVRAVWRIVSLDRTTVRAEFDRRFTAERMARDYLQIYQELSLARTRSERLRRLKGGSKALHAVQSVAAGPAPAAVALRG